MFIDEILKLINDIEYYRKDIVYKKNILREIEPKFKENIQDIFKIEVSTQSTKTFIDDTVTEDLNIDKDYVRKLYKNIALETHPDKTSTNNNLFTDAVNHYENADWIGLLIILDKVNLNKINIDSEKYLKMKEHLNDIKKESTFIEQSWYWLWHYSDNKEDLIVSFLNFNQIN